MEDFLHDEIPKCLDDKDCINIALRRLKRKFNPTPEQTKELKEFAKSCVEIYNSSDIPSLCFSYTFDYFDKTYNQPMHGHRTTVPKLNIRKMF